jgi:aspartyl-tRNA(Asn)/glutamyl-tRNA(Gln) amidotransferase subunit A
LPAMSVPCGMSKAAKPLPIGMQLIGNYVQESKLLNAAHQYQLQTQWHTMSPEMTGNLT